MLNKIKHEIYLIKSKKRTLAYTLAEMLLVMLIISLMLLALPPVTKKLYTDRTTRRYHGRFECYWRDGTLYYATSTEGGTTSGEKAATGGKCEFKPPTSSIYVLIHAIGGGGGGAYLSAEPVDGSEIITDTSEQGNTLPNLWPNWLRELRENGYQFPNNVPLNMSNETIVTGNVATLQYAFAGLQGERISMFFSKMDPNTTIEMVPGRNGSAGSSYTSYAGSDGGDTVVTFVKTLDDGSTERKELIRAEGGTGGNIAGAAKVWLYGGYPNDYGLSSLSARITQDANFVENIEGHVDSTLKSYIADAGLTPGDGGQGAYSFIKKTDSELTYTVEGVNVTPKLTFNTYLDQNSRANTDCTGKNTNKHTCKSDRSQPHSCYSKTTKKWCSNNSADRDNEEKQASDTVYSCTTNPAGVQTCTCSGDDVVERIETENFICDPDDGGSGAVVVLW